MKILAIDTSAHICAACVYDLGAEQILGESIRDIGRGHAEILMGMISEVLDQADISYQALEKIAVTCGPGSFTGVRVGLAAARGLALGLGIPAIGVGTLEGLERAARETVQTGPLATLIDARRDEVYFRLSDMPNEPDAETQGITNYASITATLNGESATLCGSGAQIVNQHLVERLPVAHALASVPIELVARIGAEKIADEALPEPVYLRAPDAKPQAGFALPRV